MAQAATREAGRTGAVRDTANPNLSAFIWSVADLLRGDYKQSEYGKVILPFTVLRRLDCVLESTKPAVLAEKALREKAGLNPEPFLLKKAKQLFFNTSPLDLKKLMGDQDHIGENLRAYIQGFSAPVRDIFERVRLHPYNISQKVQVVVEHFRAHVATLLDGRAKAMVVVASRVEAVRWKLAIEKYIQERGYKIGTLVAFSGEVIDKDSGPDPFTEHSKTLNPGLRGRDIRDAFDGGEYQVLLVANKFQTGFDQPLLCGMYVDKRLAGIQAVQTLSRLNRAHPGKDTTYVVDFVNDPGEVLEAFRTYYTTAELSATTDPNLVYDLKAKLDAAGHYDDFEVERVVLVELNPKAKQSELVAAVEPVVDRLMNRYKAAQEAFKAATAAGNDPAAQDAKAELDALALFKGDMGAYLRLYTFLSQLFDYGSTAIEKRALFYKRLLPLLELGREREAIDLSKVKLTHHVLRAREVVSMDYGKGDKPKLDPLTEAGGGSVQEKERVRLNEIIEKVNTLFEGDLSDQDKLVYVNNVLMGKLLESTTLAQQAASNTKEQFANSPDLQSEMMNAIIGALDAHMLMSTQALNSEVVQAGIKDILLNHAQLWESLRARAVG